MSPIDLQLALSLSSICDEFSFDFGYCRVANIEIEGLESSLGHVILVNKVNSKW